MSASLKEQFMAMVWNQAICHWYDGKPNQLAEFIERGWPLNEIQRASIAKILRGEAKPNAKSNAKRKLPTHARLKLENIAIRSAKYKHRTRLAQFRTSTLPLDLNKNDALGDEWVERLLKAMSSETGIPEKTLRQKLSTIRAKQKTTLEKKR
jgi:uncharacterized glyoxalase superfamily protein PhnB